ncbi:helix-turn-helix transcriptional regulator [Bradyrhizobium rifense]|uniref:helix-turn-helix transcriptional regulator n=1 Tax=Bradyrhizobium rifense TaxID=515499 RepID=UPI001FE4F109|nr:hypothetical protein [Bradyrhizobium rifense]
MKEPGSSLPIGYSRCVLHREEAAEYVGVSPRLFDVMVADGRMPRAVRLSERRYGWIQRELDAAVATLPRKEDFDDHTSGIHVSEAERKALEKFDAARQAAKAEKSPAEH